jgi:hypothetical protein
VRSSPPSFTPSPSTGWSPTSTSPQT